MFTILSLYRLFKLLCFVVAYKQTDIIIILSFSLFLSNSYDFLIVFHSIILFNLSNTLFNKTHFLPLMILVNLLIYVLDIFTFSNSGKINIYTIYTITS